MTKKSPRKSSPKARTLTVQRVFDATAKTLWTYWTDPKKFAKWFNPAPGLDLVVHEYDVRPGGRVRFDMPQPDGNPNPQKGVFHRLVPFREIVSGEPDKSFLVKVTFTPVGKRTRMTVTVTGLPAGMHEGARTGWNGGLDKLARLLQAGRGGVPKAGATGSGKELVIRRTFDAPSKRVWKAFTDPGELRGWWGPKGFTTPFFSLDLHVGGVFRYCMRSPEGKDYWGTGVIREVVTGKRIVYTDSFADEKGNVVPATYYGLNPDTPLEMLATLTFEGANGKTKVTLRHAGLPIGPDRDGAAQGWNEMFDKLAASLESRSRGGTAKVGGERALALSSASDREIVLTRTFDAARERVFRAYTDPKAIPEWWGPKGYTTRVETMDVRPGGAWRYVQHDAEGREHAFHGVYRDVVAPERLSESFEYEGTPGHIVEETITFEEQRGGKTLVTVRARFASKEDRDGMLSAGMESGLRESYERLEALLATRR